MKRLTKAQKRELDFLKNNGGWRWVCRYQLLKVYHELSEKGFVRLESGVGLGFSGGGTHAYLIDELKKGG